MGMGYVPVYEGEEEPGSGNQIRISTEKVQKLGVRTEEARVRELSRPLRAVGTLQIDERRIPREDGLIEIVERGVDPAGIGHILSDAGTFEDSPKVRAP